MERMYSGMQGGFGEFLEGLGYQPTDIGCFPIGQWSHPSILIRRVTTLEMQFRNITLAKGERGFGGGKGEGRETRRGTIGRDSCQPYFWSGHALPGDWAWV